MDERDKKNILQENHLLREVKEKPYRMFNIAFCLMTIIPFLVFIYLLATQLFSINIMIGNVGLMILSTFFLALAGYSLGYSIIRATLQGIIAFIEKIKLAYAELKETQAMLIQSERFRAVGQLASGIAHEAKNPLGVLLQDITYLEENLPPQEDISNVLNMMKRNIEKTDNIVRTLLDFSRAAEVDIKPHDINSIIENSLALIQHKVELKNIQFVKEMKDDLPKVLADGGKMEQVLVNILLNAIQAMPDGGKMFIRAYQKQLDNPGKGVGRRSDDYFRIGETAVIVEAEDTGVGIPQEHMNKLFEPFFSLKKSGEGIGLGLAVSRNIIDIHKGLIEIKSELGKGTKVIITLKAAIVEPAAAQAVAQEPQLVDKKRIMIIDDEKDFLDITKLNIEKTNRYEVMALSSAKDILSHVQNFKPDVILLDIIMPEASGLEICQTLNQDPIGKKTPVIILSALDKESEKLMAYKLGVVDYLTKPIKKDVLIAKIEKAIQFK